MSSEIASVDRGPGVLSLDLGLATAEDQEAALKEYDKRRGVILRWLKSHMSDGVDYGTPPGTGGRTQPGWRPTPSLYQAGAKKIIALLQLRDVYELADDVWRQLGSPAGVICFRCSLVHRASGEVAAVGYGTSDPAQERKGMTHHSRILMAQKRSLVHAVRTALPILGEIFTQDLEDFAETGGMPPSLAAMCRTDAQRKWASVELAKGTAVEDVCAMVRRAHEASDLRREIESAIDDIDDRDMAAQRRRELAAAGRDLGKLRSILDDLRGSDGRSP